MNGFRTNVVANFAGQFSVSVIHLVMIPQYVRFLGVEAYGLVGLFLTLQAILQVLDLGLSPTVNREMARNLAVPRASGEARDFVRTFEVAYWLAGGVLGGAVFLAAPFLATHWLQQTTLSHATLVDAVRMMGVLVAAQWPLTFYQGALLGLDRHSVLNAVRVGMSVTSAAGAVVVLASLSASIGAFFRWQVAASLINVVATAVAVWRYAPVAPGRPRFRPGLVRGVWRFAAGITGMTISGLVLTQADKVVLSRVAPLEQFGYYAVAGVLGTGLYAVISPMFASLFPRFSSLAAVGNDATLRDLYRRAWLLMAALVIPASAVMAAFAGDVLLLWTRNPVLVAAAAPLVSLLAVGTALNGLMNVPYALQLAYGWTAVPLRVNTGIALVAVPLVLLSTRRLGALGAAMMWPAVNAVSLLVMLPLTHRRFPGVAQTRWLPREVALPAAASVAVVVLCRVMLPTSQDARLAFGAAVAAWVAGELTLVLASSELRREMKHYAVRWAGYAGLA